MLFDGRSLCTSADALSRSDVISVLMLSVVVSVWSRVPFGFNKAVRKLSIANQIFWVGVLAVKAAPCTPNIMAVMVVKSSEVCL